MTLRRTVILPLALCAALDATASAAQPAPDPLGAGGLASSVRLRPRLSLARAQARVMSFPAVVARLRARGESAVRIVPLTRASSLAGCSGGWLECVYWFRVEDLAPGQPPATWRFFGVDPSTGAVCASRARRSDRITRSPCEPSLLRGRP